MQYQTPFQAGNGNQTTTWGQCIAFYNEQLAAEFPALLRFWRIGVSDDGVPIHGGVVTADAVFDRE